MHYFLIFLIYYDFFPFIDDKALCEHAVTVVLDKMWMCINSHSQKTDLVFIKMN